MNMRKFYLVFTIIVSVFLFSTGFFLVTEINKPATETSVTGGILPQLFTPSITATKDPVNILLLGGDKVGANTDTIMLINFNPETMKINILSIPRDTKVKVRGSRIDKINSAYSVGGAERSIEAVQELLGVKIQHYVYLNFAAFRKIIDKLDGVYFDIPVDLKYEDSTQNLYIDLKKGHQLLDGKKAEQLLRFRQTQNGHYSKEMRKYYDGSDLKRVNMQQKFIKAFIEQKANIKYIVKANDILEEVFRNVKTNININDAFKLASSIGKINSDETRMFRLSGGDLWEKNICYFQYNEKIFDMTSEKSIDSREILNTYFSSRGSFDNSIINNNSPTNNNSTSNSNDTTNNENTSDNSQSFTKDNPSNAETSVKGTTKPKP